MYFEVVKKQFDDSLLSVFQSSKLSPIHFAKSHFDTLSMFVDKDVLDNVINALQSDKDPLPSELGSCLQSSRVMQVLFHGLQSRMHYLLYIVEIEKQLDSLENLSFMAGEVTSFTTLMQREAANFPFGANEFKRKQAKIFFFMADVFPVLSCPDDEHYFRKAARMKGCAINAGDLEMMPWEEALSGAGGLSGISLHVRVPTELLADFKNCRDAVRSVCGSQPMRLADLRALIGSHLKGMVLLDRTFVLEYQFLLHHAEPLLLKKVHDDVLDVLPDGKEVRSFANVLLGLEKHRRSVRVFMCGASLELEIDGLIQLVRGLSEGIGIKTSTILRYSEFYKNCVKKFENFLHSDADLSKFEKGPCGPKVVTLYGPRAIEWQLSEVSRKFKSGIDVGMGEMKHFRTFDWLLSDTQRDLRERWIKTIVDSISNPLRTLKDDCSVGLDGGGGGGVGGGAGVLPSVSPSLSLVKKQPLPESKFVGKVSSSSKVKDDPLNAKMLKFFAPKGVSKVG